MQDDKAWFCDEIRNCQNSLYAFAYSILQNEEDAEDAIQDSIWKAYNNLDSLKNVKKFKPWIMKILANTAYDMLRHRRDFQNIDERYDVAEAAGGVDIDMKMSLWDAVGKLKAPYREVVVLFYYERFSIREIGEITGSSSDAVKKQLSRAREKLREML